MIRLGGKTMFKKLKIKIRLRNNLNNDLDLHNIPEHVAIIMDGNGRWAKNVKCQELKGIMKGCKQSKQLLEKRVILVLNI